MNGCKARNFGHLVEGGIGLVFGGSVENAHFAEELRLNTSWKCRQYIYHRATYGVMRYNHAKNCGGQYSHSHVLTLYPALE
jgi:hypothetical protein